MDTETGLRQLAEETARELHRKGNLRHADILLPPGYCDLVSPRQRARDLLMLAGATNRALLDLRRLPDRADFDLRIYSPGLRPLDALAPSFHNLGLPILDQMQFRIEIGAERRFVRSCLVRPADGKRLVQSRRLILEALTALLSDEAEDDALNRLVLIAGLSWKDVGVLRAYGKYYLQLGARVDRPRLYEAMLGEVDVTRLLFT